MNNMVWVIGAGLMAKEYAKVLNALNTPFTVIGRSEEKCKEIADEFGCICIPGGIENYLQTNPEIPDSVIIAVGIEALSDTATLALNYGIKNILLEKPGVGSPKEIKALLALTKKKNAIVLLAYNRRFYSSVMKAKEMIKEDGGATSCFFEFTEWSHTIRELKKHPVEHNNWFLGNSTHVIDTAFYLCGKPVELSSYTSGGLDWHPSSSVFAGAGKTEKDVLFSYIANWAAPGRWVLEIMTKNKRLIFKPMEKLQVMNIGSVAVGFVEGVDYSDDEEFKPGLYLQTKAFLQKDYNEFCSLDEQDHYISSFYNKMSNYNNF